MSGLWLVAAVLAPLAMLAACLAAGVRERIAGWLWIAPIPGLCAALFAADAPALVADAERFRFTLELTPAGATLLGVASLLWIAGGAYARVWLRGDPRADRFAEWWLLTLAGSLGVFFAGDLLAFYVAYAMVSLAAWGLVVYDDTARVRRAGAIYVGLALLGEIFLLLAFALLAAETPGDSVAIRDVVAALPFSPTRDFTLAFLLLGFGLKIALVPLHVWMPLTYAAAPHPAAAVLSGAAVKAGVIGLIQFLPFDAAMTGWGTALAAAGIFAAYYGVAIGVTQSDPKAILAYSSISQMGGIAAVLGVGLASGDARTADAASFAAAHHVLVKGGLFFALGVFAMGGVRAKWLVIAPAVVIGLGLAGLPPTGGALAKLATKELLGSGAIATLAKWSAAGTTLLMLHFSFRLAASAPREPKPATALTAIWLATAAAALVAPWWLALRNASSPLRELLAAATLGSDLGPLLLGAAGALALHRWARALPRVPAGDLIVVGERLGRASDRWSRSLERADLWIETWPAAGVALLGVALAIGVAFAAGR